MMSAKLCKAIYGIKELTIPGSALDVMVLRRSLLAKCDSINLPGELTSVFQKMRKVPNQFHDLMCCL